MAQIRLVGQRAHRHDFAAGDVGAAQHGNAVFRRMPGHPAGDMIVDFVAPQHARAQICVTLVAAEFRLADHFADFLPMRFGCRTQQHPAIAGAIGVPRRRHRMAVAETARLAATEMRGEKRRHRIHGAVVQRHVDRLRDAAETTHAQACDYRRGGIKRGREFHHGRANRNRRARALACRIGDAADRLQQEIRNRYGTPFGCPRTERGDVADDGRQCHGVGIGRGDHNISGGDQLQQGIVAGLAAPAQALFAVGEKIALTELVLERSVGSCAVRFGEEHRRAELRQQGSRRAARQPATEFTHHNAIERARRGHGSATLKRGTATSPSTVSNKTSTVRPTRS